jgi:hypothetical protein
MNVQVIVHKSGANSYQLVKGRVRSRIGWGGGLRTAGWMTGAIVPSLQNQVVIFVLDLYVRCLWLVLALRGH